MLAESLLHRSYIASAKHSSTIIQMQGHQGSRLDFNFIFMLGIFLVFKPNIVRRDGSRCWCTSASTRSSNHGYQSSFWIPALKGKPGSWRTNCHTATGSTTNSSLATPKFNPIQGSSSNNLGRLHLWLMRGLQEPTPKKNRASLTRDTATMLIDLVVAKVLNITRVWFLQRRAGNIQLSRKTLQNWATQSTFPVGIWQD